VNPEPAALMLVWRWKNGTTSIQDFTYEGDLSGICKEISASMEVVDGGVSFWRNVAGDLLGENLRLQEDLRQARLLEDFVLDQIRGPLAEALK
jgi:hypothetical protein